MKFSTLAVILGAAYSALQLYVLTKPDDFAKSARKFPRSFGWGILLMPIGTAWFLYNLNNETISDFAAYKGPMLTAFAAIGFGSCIFVRDYLAVRGMSVVLLLLASYTLSYARWADSAFRMVVSAWCYVWIILAMWWTISPWRCRDYIQWLTASPKRLRTQAASRLALGVVIIALGCTVFREQVH